MRIFLLAAVAALSACQGSALPSSDDNADQPLGAVLDPASEGSASATAKRYAAAITAGRLGEAYALLAPGAETAHGGSAGFGRHFADRRKLAMTLGKAGDPVDVGRQRLVEVPAVLSGMSRAGAAFRVEGPILLRVAEKSASPDTPPRWEIVRAPFPA